MAGDSSEPVGVVTATQAGAAPLTVFAAPATSTEFNTLGERLVPKACFKVEDLLFEFGSSFIRPELKNHLPKLTQLRNDNKVAGLFPPLSIFGHADPVGDIDLNKVLSGRRAIAFYAMLVRDVDLWEGLFTPPVHDDSWGTRSIQTMLSTVQEPIGIDGVGGQETQTAIRTFQKANGLGVDGVAGPATRKVLYRAYMDNLCGPELKLDKTNDFLAHNKDGAGGKGDFQGCSEFNPLRVFSKSETAGFAATTNHKARNEENAPNRRVVVLLFAPGRRVNPSVWPCPRAKEGVAGCKKRFFPDAEVRRNPQGDRREFEDTKDTFACRFYQIISDDSPCERVKPAPPAPVLLGVNPLILFAIADSTVTAAGGSAAQSFVSATAPSTGAITPLKDIVLVKKPYTNPTRVEVVLKTDTSFDGNAVLTVNDPNSILLFPTRTSKVPLTFKGDNTFKGAQLDPKGPGVSLFAEGKTASANMRDFVMTLRLSGGTKKPGPDAVGRMTAIELILDICAPRVNATTNPVPLPQAPAVTPATPTDKFFLGRPVPIQDDAKIQERAMLIVQPVKTSGFAALNRKLVLVRIGSHIKTFANETPSTTTPDPEIASRHTLTASNTATNFFVEGVSESNKVRDNSYQLGIDGLDGDGDRVSVTVVHSEIVSDRTLANVHAIARVPEKPARTTRSTFLPAPLIVGLKFPVELRAFMLKASPQAFQWTIQGAAAATLTDTTKVVVKMSATSLSAKQDDTMLQARLTTDVGQFLRRHRITVVHVTLDSVANGDIFSGNPAINSIRNPAGLVILTGADAADATKVAKVEMVKFPVPAVPAAPGKPGTPATPAALGIEPNLTWTDDDDRIAWWIVGDDGGQYTGKADFRNAEAAKRGTKIEIFGTKEGDVLIQPYSGGFGYGMLRTNVVNLRKVKYRVNRISTNAVAPVPPSPGKPGKPGKLAHGPTRNHQDALNHIKMANVYLRQSGIELIPDNSNDVAVKTHNAKIGVNAIDPHVVSVTKSALSDGHFDVVVDQISMTFRALDNGNSAAEGAIRVNARNEIITIAYIESLAPASGPTTLAQAQLIPANHAKGGVLRDKGVPSSSLIKKTGIPGDTPVGQVTLAVLPAIGVGAQPATPANGARNINLLWGITVPTRSVDAFVIRPDIVAVGANSDMIYGTTLAHEVGHVLGLKHRIPPGVLASPQSKQPDPFPDRLSTPKTKNLMFPQLNVATAENLDIVQVKAIRLSEVLVRNP
jgi:putative peptidoglycan binding protein